MRFVIVTGMSGAGKSSVLKMLEDIGFFCVDNLPIQLLKKFAQLSFGQTHKRDRVAIGIDIRSGQALDEVEYILKELKVNNYSFEILFLESSNEVLIKRYKETRRTHPLAGTGRIEQGIKLERKRLEFLKEKADIILDSSQMLIRELKAEITDIYANNKKYNNFYITILSFGFKYGTPVDADMVLDVRFLPNPYYVTELKSKTGNDKDVVDYVMSDNRGKIFLDKLEDLLKFLIPNYIVEGKNQLVIGIGCTGGKHRSVTIANQIEKRLVELDYALKVEHRDMEKDSLRV